MKPLLLALGLAILLPLSGCLEGDVSTDANADADADTGTPTRAPRASGNASADADTGNGTASGNATGNRTAPGNQTSAEGNATGNATGNGTGNATWTYENRTGRVSGTVIPVVSPSFSKTETFNVTNGTERLLFNLTSTGTQVTLTVSPPGCTTAACANQTKTTDGKANLTYDAPAAGIWSAKLSVTATVGSVQADYRLVLGRLAVPAGNATAPP